MLPKIEWEYPVNRRWASLRMFDTNISLEEDLNTNKIRLSITSYYCEPYDKYELSDITMSEVEVLLNSVNSRKELRNKLTPVGTFRGKDGNLGISNRNLKDGLNCGLIDKEDYDNWSSGFFKQIKSLFL